MTTTNRKSQVEAEGRPPLDVPTPTEYVHTCTVPDCKMATISATESSARR